MVVSLNNMRSDSGMAIEIWYGLYRYHHIFNIILCIISYYYFSLIAARSPCSLRGGWYFGGLLRDIWVERVQQFQDLFGSMHFSFSRRHKGYPDHAPFINHRKRPNPSPP